MSSPAATRRGVHEGLARATSAGRRACCSNYVSCLPCPPNTRSELLIGRSTRYSAVCGAHTQEATNFENTLLLVLVVAPLCEQRAAAHALALHEDLDGAELLAGLRRGGRFFSRHPALDLEAGTCGTGDVFCGEEPHRLLPAEGRLYFRSEEHTSELQS